MSKRWTDEEREYVIDVWGEVSINRIAKKLNRTPMAITRFAEKNKLGGCMLQNELYLSVAEASEMIGVDPTSVIAWIKTKKLKAKSQTLKKRKVYRIDPVDFKEFLINNQNRWKATKLKSGLINTNEKWFLDKLSKDSKPLENKRKTLWTYKEEVTLIEFVKQGKSDKEISSIMNRTRDSVNRKKGRLRKEGRL